MSLISERVQPVVLANIVAGTSYAATGSTPIDMESFNADSVLIVAVLNATTGNGFQMTAQGSASSGTGFSGYCVAAGSTTSLLTVSSTAAGLASYIDMKDVPHRFVRVTSTGLGACNVTITAFPYDSKSQPVTVQPVAGSFIASVSPTSA